MADRGAMPPKNDARDSSPSHPSEAAPATSESRASESRTDQGNSAEQPSPAPRTPAHRSIVDQLAEYVPGKSIAEVRERWQLDRVIKIASNENPMGVSPKALAALAAELPTLNLYPIGHAPKLTQAVADKLSVATNQLIFANGSDEAIWLICTAFLNPGEEVLCSENTFSEYRFCALLLDGRYRSLPQRRGYFDLDAIANGVTERTKLVFVCNPNNPTGTYLTETDLRAFLQRLPEHVLVVVDQAYHEYADAPDYPDLTEETRKRRNLVLLRTFSKIYGLAGLRIGYAIAHPDVIATLYKVKQPFNVNQLAQVAAQAAIDDDDFVQRTLAMNAVGKAYLYDAFKRLGVEALPTQANFIAARIGERAAELCEFLESRGLIVRHLRSFDLPDWIRITVGTQAENQSFVKLFEEFFHETA